MPAKTPPLSHLAAQKFSSALRRARMDKGMSQSDLARSVWGTTEDNKGYTVAKNRDLISSYERGRSAPTRDNLEKMAGVLGLDVADLSPETVAKDIDRERPAIALQMLEGRPNHVHLTVNTVTDLTTATQIVAMLDKARSG